MSANRDSETTPLPASCDARDEMLTKPELAAKLKIAPRTVENWKDAGYLPYLKIAHLVLFYWPDVVQHLRTNFRVCRFQPDNPVTGTAPVKGERK